MNLFHLYPFPKRDKFSEITHSFSITEKVIFYVLFATLFISTFFLVIKINASYLIEVPTGGGVIEEGVIGTPRFINPLLAISEADKDLVALVYSGLLRATPEGNFIPDLASEYSISEDGLSYYFKIKDNASFHDGTPVTSDDVEYTIMMALDSNLKSPKRVNWDGVTVEKISEKEIRFVLKQAYSPFLENTTIGILPKNIWKNVSSEQFPFSQFNIEPIGSGPYKIKSLRRDSAGLPSNYTLSSFDNFALGQPYISRIILRFYKNENELLEAYEKGAIKNVGGISPEKANLLEQNKSEIHQTTLPRIFGLFLNQNQAPIFLNSEVRNAFNISIDRQRIVNEVFYGLAKEINSPIPVNFISTEKNGSERNIEEARAMLEKGGWKWSEEDSVFIKETGKGSTAKKETLQFSISTSNSPELKAVANIIKENLEELGAKVELQFFETTDLNQNIIRTRKYDILLFGVVTGRDLDMYPFWHSSQRNDPGLNIALYTNIIVDRMIERARATTSSESKDVYLKTLLEEITKDKPAVFIFSPDFVYIVSKKIQNVTLGNINSPSERFLTIYKWHIETEKVWKLFTR